MKLVYLTPHLASPAGMERVLHNKICWFVRQGGYEITIITTDQGSSPIYFNFPSSVEILDLGINYSSVYTKSPFFRLRAIQKKRKIHFKRLSELLKKIKPDITITLYPSDRVAVSKIKDGSKKIIEFHHCRFFRLYQGRKGLHRLVAWFRVWQDYRFSKKFDKLVVLTPDAANQWGNLSNIEIIPNAITSVPNITLNLGAKRVISVGRLIYDKGFDRLLKAWALLPEDILSEWKLDIYGQGPEEANLNRLIDSLNLNTSARINGPTKEIFKEYANSAFLVMASRTEGLPMVLLEAMSCGLPGVCFDFPQGAKDVIEDGVNGFLVENGNIPLLSEKIEKLIRDNNLRYTFSNNAKLIRDIYSENRVMQLWKNCFAEILSSN